MWYVWGRGKGACVGVYECVWRPEIDTGCLPQWVFTLFTQAGTLDEPGTCKFSYPACPVKSVSALQALRLHEGEFLYGY